MENNSFFIDQSDIQTYNDIDNYLLISDIVLMILLDTPIHQTYQGIDKIQMLVFLYWKQFLSDISLDPVFFPTMNGPYSIILEQSLNILIKKEYITKETLNDNYSIRITIKGEQKIKDKVNRIGIDLQSFPNNRHIWKHLSDEDFKSYINSIHPEYILKSLKSTVSQNTNYLKIVDLALRRYKDKSIREKRKQILIQLLIESNDITLAHAIELLKKIESQKSDKIPGHY